MKMRTPLLSTLALALAAATAGTALAQAAAPQAPSVAQQQQLDAARAALDAAAKHYGELARRYGVAQHALQYERRLLRKPVIGVVLAPATEGGVRIAGVTPGSAAAAAGLAGGDRIIAIDGKVIAGSDAEARVEAAREAIGAHDAGSSVRLRYLRNGKEGTVALAPRVGDRMIFLGTAPIATPKIRREVIRMGDCEEPPCAFPVLAEALRWNGFNLASLDRDLGGYFGTSKGVLVVSAGPELKGLRAGDVIQSVAGKPVDSPRAVMDALRGRKTGDKVEIGYLRNRTAGTTMIAVPEPMRFPVPPEPPAPPPPPAAPAPPAPPAPPPAPPAPPVD